MQFIEDLKIKQLEKFVGACVGKKVSILSLAIDPDIYFCGDDDGEYIPDTDFQVVTVTYSEHGKDFGKELHTAEFTWGCAPKELNLSKHID